MATLHVYFADMPHYGAAGGKSRASDAIAVVTVEDDSLTALQQRHRLSPSSSSVSPTPRYERNLGFFQQLSRRFGLRSSDDLVYNAEDDSTDSCSSTTGHIPPMQSSSATSMSSTSTTRSGNNNSNNIHSQSGIKSSQASSMEHISCASSETSSTIDIDDRQQQPPPEPVAKQAATKERKSLGRSSFSRLHRRSTSSLRRAFESFSLSSRSLSCSGATPPAQREGAASVCSMGNTPIKSALKSSSNMELNKKSHSVTLSFSATPASATSKSSSTSSSSKTKVKPPPQRILRQPVSYTYLKGISGLPTQRVPRSAVCCQYARR